MDLARRGRNLLAVLALACAPVAACGGNPVPDGDPAASARAGDPVPKGEAGESVTPPFPVQGELDGLVLVWFDAEGMHSARRRADIPEASRAEVRVDSLRIAPGQRLDPEHVLVADVRVPRADGSYAVKKHTRAWFESRMDALAPRPKPTPTAIAGADTGVTMYRTSWCGVCRTAAAYFRKNGIAFVEKDVEQDPGASEEMLKKAQRVGRTPNGVPVIDFHGNLMFGFDEDELDRLVAKHNSTQG